MYIYTYLCVCVCVGCVPVVGLEVASDCHSGSQLAVTQDSGFRIQDPLAAATFMQRQ